MAEDRPVSTVNSDYATPLNSPLPFDQATLEPPRASFFSPSLGQSTPRESIAPSASGPEQDRDGLTPAESTTFLPAGKESGTISPQGVVATKPLYRRPTIWAIAFAALVAIILIIILPVYFAVIHKNHGSSNLANNNNGTGGNGGGNGNNPPTSTPNATTGGNGSTIVSGNTSFTYINPFGGFCEFSLALHLLPFSPQEGFFFLGALSTWCFSLREICLYLTHCSCLLYFLSISLCGCNYWF